MTQRFVGPVGGTDKTYVAESALTRGYGVSKGAAQGNVTATTVAGARCVGVVSESVSVAGREVAITRDGDAVAFAGAAIPYQAFVKQDATGRFIPVTGTAGGGEEVAGRAESIATQAGDEFILFFKPFIL